MRNDLKSIVDWIKPDSHLLDLGCGNGTLLAHLHSKKNVSGYGIEIDETAISECIKNGVDVIQKDIDGNMTEFADQSFDYVVMSQSLQTMRHTDKVLLEMLRVGREGIISFPNMGYIKGRIQLALFGHMPVTKSLAHTWYETPNIHLCTVKDFKNLCKELDIEIVEFKLLGNDLKNHLMMRLFPNLLGKVALYRVRKKR